MTEKLAKLLTVKSIVTILLTVVFAVLLLNGSKIPEQFTTIYTVVIGFYFGTQAEKASTAKAE